MTVVLKTENGRFNYRVCAVILNDNKILAMTDENASADQRKSKRILKFNIMNNIAERKGCLLLNCLVNCHFCLVYISLLFGCFLCLASACFRQAPDTVPLLIKLYNGI